MMAGEQQVNRRKLLRLEVWEKELEALSRDASWSVGRPNSR